MQYLLTEEEFKNLVPREQQVLDSHALAAAREKILSLATFVCIHAHGSKTKYCDNCPCSPIHSDDDKIWKRVCWLEKKYSK